MPTGRFCQNKKRLSGALSLVLRKLCAKFKKKLSRGLRDLLPTDARTDGTDWSIWVDFYKISVENRVSEIAFFRPKIG